MANDETKKTPEATPVAAPAPKEAPKDSPPPPAKDDPTIATGETLEVPVTPEEIAERGTEISNTSSEAAGGQPADPNDPAGGSTATKRLWAMDNDHTTDNRTNADPLKPDMVEWSGGRSNA